MANHKGNTVGQKSNQSGAQFQQGGLSAGLHDFNQQCLRILRCTAEAMASGPGGLRFQAGTRPWLEGLAGGRQVPAGLPAAVD